MKNLTISIEDNLMITFSKSYKKEKIRKNIQKKSTKKLKTIKNMFVKTLFPKLIKKSFKIH